jgi:alcohol dehydrogenase class IV
MHAGRYDFISQDRVIFGEPAVKAVLDESTSRRSDRIFIVSGKSLNRKTDLIRRIASGIGDRFCGVFDECIAHTPRSSVIAAAVAIKRAEPDLIVSVGGGTVIDTAKMALLCLAEGITSASQLDDYKIVVRNDGTRFIPDVKDPPLCQIAVPTTLSAAEYSILAGCTDTERKVKDTYSGDKIGPQSIILDPAATIHTPDWLWLSTGIRAVDHAVETICSRSHQDLTDATSLYGLRMLYENLPHTKNHPEDLAARLNCQLGSWLAAFGIGRAEWGASHGIGHQLGGAADVPHGYTSAVMLHNVLRHNYPVNSDRQKLISEALGHPESFAADLIRDLVTALGLPTRLRDAGVQRDQFDTIACGSMQDMMVRSNPRSIQSKDDVLVLLEQAW